MIDPETNARPPAADGRNIDQALGALRGEGALQEIGHLEPERPYQARPRRDEATSDELSYYGLPALKEAVWKWPVPLYFYVGGLAGASAALSAAASLRGGELRRLVRAGRLIAAGGAAVSAGLLIQDLGIRSRFVYMMRVFRPSSPMNLGTWLLGAFGAAAGASAVLPGVAGDVAGGAAGILGLPLSGYTAVLIANTAVPLWQEARTLMPPLFVASAAVSAASAMEMLRLDARAQRSVRALAVMAKVAELTADTALEHGVSAVPRVARPLHRGRPGALWTAARLCTAASLLISLVERKSRRLRFVAGLLGTAGALATRFALFEAGKASARDPHAVFEQQRAGHGAAEVSGAAAARETP